MELRAILSMIPILLSVGCYENNDTPTNVHINLSAEGVTDQVPNLIKLGVFEKFEHEPKIEFSGSTGSIEADGLFDPRILELVRDREEESVEKADAPLSLQTRVYSPAYTPICTQLNPNTIYTMSGTTTGSLSCFYFETTVESVKVEARLFNQLAGNDHSLLVAQDDPANPYTFPFALISDLPGNTDERIQFLSDAGHYYIQIEANVSDGSPFFFALNFIEDFDEHELNETIATATTLTSGQPITANIDSPRDVDFYEYSLIGTELVMQVQQNPNFHSMWISFDEGQNWDPLTGSGTLDLTPHLETDTVLIGVMAAANVDPATTYTLGLWDNKGMTFSHLQGEIIRSVNTGIPQGQPGHLIDQTIPGYWVDGHPPLRGGVHEHRVRFYGQLRLSDGSPAVFRNFTFGYTRTFGGIGNTYHQESHFTDINGYYEVFAELEECHGYRTHFHSVSGLNPNLWFLFDRERYEILGNTVNGVQALNTANEYFFNICQVREENSTGALLNSFTYQ